MYRERTATRRTVLGAVGAATVAGTSGCTDILGSGEPVTVWWTLEEVGSDEPLTDGREQELDPGSYFSDGFEIVETTEVAYSIEVLEGPNVNVFVLDERNQDAFDDDEEFTAIEESISIGVSFTEHPGIELDPGTYALIILNGDGEPENA
ncbi:Uncharacterized protein HSBGL_2377 [Halapricum desulfuricans]|uniref:Uncharacterized protein n=1 Tax=Halapricum desulfuricans TaxID=2841257 RepID=A0A897NJ67_9EURY|nr:hypothetical protein [Halapricum desulfuricans]QSG12782.1 Uncharacterized protein HSBGL_2377 [Halapricum desulfuricans]